MSKSQDERRHQRYDLMASVEVHAGEETVILPARNLSLGGIYVSHDGNDLSQFPDGSAVDILVFDVADETRPPVRGTAHVVRHDAHGMALRWDEDGATHDAVLGLLQSLKKSA